MIRPRSVRWRAVIFLASILLYGPAVRSQDVAESSAAPDASAPTASSPSSEPSSDDNANPSASAGPVQPGVLGLDHFRGALPNGSFQDNPPGIPYSQVLNTTGADVDDINVVGGRPLNTTFPAYPKAGGAEGSLTIAPFNGALYVPFFRHAAEPEDADIKAGPFYVKFHSADGLVLYDDNFNESQTDRRAETLVLLRLNLTIIAQITDSLQFALTGEPAYLPLQNQFGVESSVYDSLGLLATGPLLASQLIYDTVIAGWPVRFADDFRSGLAFYSDDTRDNFDLFQGDYLERDEQGRYSLLAERAEHQNNGFGANPQSSSVVYYSNIVSALTDRLLPGDVRLTLRVENQDLWYNQSNRGLPPSRDDFYASLVSERENMRFKPYAIYEATYVQTLPGVTQQIRAGFFGPIDDQLFLRAEVGYYGDGFDHQGLLYLLKIDHDAGPYTTEHLVLDRGLNYFDQEQQTTAYYSLDQVLGPTLWGTLLLAHSSYQELVNDGTASRSDDLGGLQLVWTLGPKTNLQLGAIYEREDYSNGLRYNTVTGRVILNRSISDTLSLQLFYEYQNAIANRPGESYYENLVYLRMVKFFE